MLQIYGVYRSRASWVIWMALELGLRFEHHPVIPAYRIEMYGIPDSLPHSGSKDFLKINANGKVPVLIDDDLVLNQSLAANLYLARKYGGPLAAKDLAEEAQMSMWTHWVATEVEHFAADILHHRVTYPEQARQPEVADAAVSALKKPFSVLNDKLEKTEWLVGDRFSVADLNVAAVIQSASGARELFVPAPAVVAWLNKCHARPAYKELLRQREAQPEWTK